MLKMHHMHIIYKFKGIESLAFEMQKDSSKLDNILTYAYKENIISKPESF